MRTLDLKLWRDLGRHKGQVFTIALVVACGVAAFVAAIGTYRSLVAARDTYYSQARFADVFVALKRAPERLGLRLAELPGVAEAETRLVFEATVHAEGDPVPITGRIVSLPDAGAPRLNRIRLRRGRLPEVGRGNEAVVNEAFLLARRLRLGDGLAVVLNGRRQQVRIVGTALSPECIYAVRSAEEVPDDRRFGVFWMRRKAVERAFDMEGAFNAASLRLAPGASREAAMAATDRALAAYGGLGAYERKDQTSARFIDDEIAQQGFMASTIPVILLAVAAFLLNIVLARLVSGQRNQIATLKALGYTDGVIGAHYLKYAAIIIGLGATLGTALGYWLGALLTGSYQPFFRFPTLEFRFEAWLPAAGIAISAAAGALGALAAVRRVARLPPAEAMRPPAPRYGRYGWLDRGGWLRRLPARLLMVLRPMLSRPWRSVMSIVAIAAAMPIIVLGLFWRDAIGTLIDVAFGLADRSTFIVSFTDPVEPRVLIELAGLPGALAAEGYRGVPVRLRAGHRTYRTGLEGLPARLDLRRPLDVAFRPIAVPAAGLLLTERLAERLQVKPGDRIVVEVLEGRRPVREVAVAGLSQDLVGMAARMELGALARLLGEGPTVSAAAVLAGPRQVRALYARLRAAPKVATVSIRREAAQTFLETTLWLVLAFSAILTAFALAIAVGVIYNNARIALAERAWELASLRILGFTRGEIFAILIGQLAIELCVALPFGIELAYWCTYAVAEAQQSDSFRIPIAISPATYGIAAGAILAAALLSAAIVWREINRLDLLGVLKMRE
ncbi:MAG: ABC transporter permease [Rhodospirillaceae bacterium]|nr:ABC transporter permease [Rhodospirillaceae bacterium]